MAGDGTAPWWPRPLVLLVVALTAASAFELPSSFDGLGILVVLTLITLDVLLLRATGSIAFIRRRTLDEREAALRDLACRRAYRVLGPVIAVAALLFGNTMSQKGPDSVITEGVLIALIELLVMAPTMLVAWMDTGSTDSA